MVSLFSTDIVSIKSCRVVWKTSKFAKGAVFGLYMIPIIADFFALICTSTKQVSITWGMKTLKSFLSVAEYFW